MVMTKDSVSKCDAAFSILQRSPIYAHLNELVEAVEGEVITPNFYEKYNLARSRPFNVDQQGYPLLIVRVNSAKDISESLKFIMRNGRNQSMCGMWLSQLPLYGFRIICD